MRKNCLPLILIVFLLPLASFAQLPQSNLIYANFGSATAITVSDSLYNYDPTQPVSATNPSLNTILLPDQNAGLAISPVLGSSDTTLTFYTSVNSVFWYYDHNTALWVNTGDTIGDLAAVNLGAGGGYIYSLQAQGFFPSVYKYDGTGNATFVAGVQSPRPYDMLVDCSGNFYILSLIGPMWSFTEYSPSGSIVQGYTVSNPNNWAPSGGMANIGHDIYTDIMGQSNFAHATLSGSTLTFDNSTANMPYMLAGNVVKDMANVASSLSDILPFISISTADTIGCPGFTATFSSNVTNASPGGQYQWYVNSAAQFNAVNSTFSYQPSDGDTVRLHYTSGASCGNVTAISAGIVMHAGIPPTHIDYGTGPFCRSAGTLSPVVTGAQGGTYSAQAGLLIDVNTGNVNTISSIPGTYIISYSVGAGGGCSTTAADTITIDAVDLIISAAIPSPASACTACDGKVVLHGLTPGQIDTVLYTRNGTAQSNIITAVAPDSTITLVNLCTGTYSLRVKSGSCASMPVVALVASPSIQPGFTYSVHFGCHGDTVLFNNTSSASSTPSYSWQFGDQSSDTSKTPVHVYASQGNYDVQLKVHTTGCTDSISQSIDLMHPLAAGFTSSADTICQGRGITFTNISVATGAAWQWTFGDGGNDTASSPVHTFDHAGIFKVGLLVSDFVPCFDSAFSTVVVDSVGPIKFTLSDSIICQGHGVSFSCNCLSQNSKGNTWNFGDNSLVSDRDPVNHAYEHPGTYEVSFTASFRACPDTTFSRSVTVSPYPVVNIGPDTAMCPGAEPLRLVDTINVGMTAAHWLWNTGDTTAAITAVQPGLYYATVTMNGCANADSVMVRNDCYIAVPNVFTPNGDGENDYFFPRQYLSASLAAFKMNIYNRWGQLVFEANSINGRGWDGKFNDEPQPEGVFIYVIDATFENGSHEHHNGNVTLLR